VGDENEVLSVALAQSASFRRGTFSGQQRRTSFTRVKVKEGSGLQKHKLRTDMDVVKVTGSKHRPDRDTVNF
jgi:urate oxidase